MSSSAQVLVPLAPGFEEVEAVTIIDLLRRADIAVYIAGVPQAGAVEGAHGIAVRSEIAIAAVVDRTFDAVILPGGMPGTKNLAASGELETILKRHRDQGHWTAAICAAPTVLAKHGLLEGKSATSYPGFEDQLQGAKVKTDSVVEDGKVITSRGPGTAIPFALKIIEKLVGKETATRIGKEVLYST